MNAKKVYHVVGITALVVFAALALATSPGPRPLARHSIDMSRRPLFPGEQVIGTVEAGFTRFNDGRASRAGSNAALDMSYSGRWWTNNAAYAALVEAAENEFGPYVDVRDVTWERRGRVWGGRGLFNYTAFGTVIRLDDVPGIEELQASQRRLRPGEQPVEWIEATFTVTLPLIDPYDLSWAATRVQVRAGHVRLNNAAYAALMAEAESRFDRPVTVRDVQWRPVWYRRGMQWHEGDVFEYEAVGRVVFLPD